MSALEEASAGDLLDSLSLISTRAAPACECKMHAYKAPLRDIRFVIHEVLELGAHYRALGRDDVTPDLVDSVLEEMPKCVEYGATSIQVMRRLRALLEELSELVLPENRAAVEAELRHLDVTVVAAYPNTVDLAAARSADHQGIGGPAVMRARGGFHERA